jgi:glycosyltransferase involved in cell wall biosynthesis
MTNEELRVCLLTIGAYPHVGGKSSHMAMIERALPSQGIEVRAVSATSLPALSRVARSDAPRLALDRLDRGRGLAWSYRKRALLLAPLVRSGGYALVHCHDVPAFDTLAIAGHPARHSVLTVHGDAVNEYLSEGKLREGSQAHRWLWAQEVRAYQGAGLVLAVDSRLQAHVRGASGRADVLCMPNFVDTEVFAPGSIPAAPLLPARFVILCPRRLVPKNGVDVAVRALPLLPEECTLVLVGDGPEREALLSLAVQLGVAHRVMAMGAVPNETMPQLYRSVQAVVLPSVASQGVIEATSIACLEAMSAARAVVASDLGGLAELLADGETGCLVPSGDHVALARSLEGLVQNPGRAAWLGANARQVVMERYSLTAACSELVRLYRELLS